MNERRRKKKKHTPFNASLILALGASRVPFNPMPFKLREVACCKVVSKIEVRVEMITEAKLKTV